jgi:hypothetical protein
MYTMLPQKNPMRAPGFALLALTLVLGLGFGLGCSGASKDIQSTEPDPPWVAQYQSTARAGCECKTEACFAKAKQELDTLVADHGGFDEVPLNVHEANKKFDPCWRAGTTDLSRDLAKLADALCRCTETSCVQSFRVSMVNLEDKYGTNFEGSRRASLSEDVRSELSRADQCLGALSVPGDEYLAYMEETTVAICACSEIECLRKVLRERLEKFKGRVFIDSLPAVQSKLDIANGRYCGCLGESAAQELADSVRGGIPPQLNMGIVCGN